MCRRARLLRREGGIDCQTNLTALEGGLALAAALSVKRNLPIMDRIETLQAGQYNAAFTPEEQARAIDALESGSVLVFPQLNFSVSNEELKLFRPALVGKSKNVSYDIRTDSVGGATIDGAEAAVLKEMISRYAKSTRALLDGLLPSYEAQKNQARTSFRPVEVEGRVTSWRKDDTRLHVDSFPSAPTHGKRILRVFANVNPNGKPRVWRVGEPFENMAKRFLPAVKRPFPGSLAMMQLMRITKSRRTEYDHTMLQLHDLMKADERYQAEVDQITHEFPAGSTWMAYADQVSHAAMRGQFQFEQTFLIPIGCQRTPERSPLKVLERLSSRALV